ncbi:MAG: T9SS type A sorting domain-containing protein [Bacteroidetes bacterium]|nr:T9SS type A sorting domain-containing protein [Bacteroidota bacterium]
MKKIFFLSLFFVVSISHAQIGTLEASLKLTTLDGITLPFQNGMAVPSFEKQPRTVISLAGAWKKQRFSANHSTSMVKRDSAGLVQILSEASGRESQYFNDGAWSQQTIPGVENTLRGYEKVPERYEDGVWYRTKFSVPDSLQQKFTKLIFYAVNYTADVWLNGKYLGWHEGGYTPFAFDVSSAIRFDSANVLAVRVDNIPWGTRQDIVPYYLCDWFNYAGIIHDVYLEFSEKISVVRADVVPQNINGLLKTTVVLTNTTHSQQNVDVKIQVFKAKTDSVSLTKEISAELAGEETVIEGSALFSLSIPADSLAVWQPAITVVNPQLWSPNHPNLYIMKITLSQEGETKDEFSTQFGIRTISIKGDRILFNGKEIFLHGVARHEDHPDYGRSLPKNVIYNDLQLVKSVNANYLRSGHYPNHPYTYLIADRLGLVIMEEIPVWWFDVASAWAIQNYQRQIHLQMFREMAFRDYNRPSIGLWSLSNECKDVAGRSTFFQNVQTELDTKYPDGRLITQSAAADRPGAYDQSQKYTDVAGWTMYFGIFYDPWGVGDYFGTKYFLVDTHDFFPDKPIFNTEFGYWSGETRTHYAEQNQTFDSVFLAFKTRLPITETGAYNHFGFLAGITWWCIFDWYTAQSSGGFQSMGLMQMNRLDAKPVMTRVKNMYKLYAPHSEYITTVERTNEKIIPSEFSLHQNFPNPFNPSTTITFALPQAEKVTVKVFDLLGKEVETLVHEHLEAGTYQRQWNPQNLSSGIYFCRFHAGNFTALRKMILLK